MTILVTLSPELEALLQSQAVQRGQDVNRVASELLGAALVKQETTEAIKGIQQGLDDFEAGRCRSFQAFAQEQHHKYNLSANPSCIPANDR
jgi:predicted transcriptional regulator